jgi:nucleoside-diphosphate-sugar epimerase
MSRWLVTGCAGFIGSHLTEALLAAGDEVVGVDAFTDYYPRPLKEANLDTARASDRFRLVEADVAEAALAELVEAADGVFHLAAQPGVLSWGTAFRRYLHDNVLATQVLFEAMRGSGKRVVLASSSSVYGDAESYPTPEDARPRPVSPYGVTKLDCEHLAGAYAASSALDAVALRYFTVYGPRQRPDMAIARIVDALLGEGEFRVFGTGEASRDFTYVADAVSATILAMSDGTAGTAYNVGGGTEATLREVIALCERHAGRSLDVRHEEPVAGYAARTAADTMRIRSELGWRPATSLDAGVAAQVEWARARRAT